MAHWTSGRAPSICASRYALVRIGGVVAIDKVVLPTDDLASIGTSDQAALMLTHVGKLQIVHDVDAAAWVVERLAPWDLGSGRRVRVRSMVSAGFAAYGRLLHPASHIDDRGVVSRMIRWADLARANGTEVQPNSSFSAISGWDLAKRDWGHFHPPRDGDLDPGELARLFTTLENWTDTPEQGWFCVWEGYGWDELRNLEGIPSVCLEHRACLLCRGPLEHALSLPHSQTPTMWWPDDKAWCVRTDIDGYSTYIAASQPCINALVALDSLEVLIADPADDIPLP